MSNLLAVLPDIDEIATTLESLPTILAALFAPIDEATLRTRPDVNEWCPLEVVGHLIACDSSAFRDRIRSIVDGNGEIAPFDPWAAINDRDFAAQPVEAVLDELAAERSISAGLIRSLTSADLAKMGVFGDGRQFAARDFVYEWPFHDQDHIQQILACTKLAYLGPMTATMRDALTAE